MFVGDGTERRDDLVGAVTPHVSARGARVARVLGVDPGLTRCGLGVVDGLPGRPPGLVAVGVVRTDAADDIATRLLAIEAEVERWLTEYQPDAVAVERVFSQHNVRTVMGTAQAGKDQVTTMVTRLLRMPDRPSPADAADALALAICHLWRSPAVRARQPVVIGGGS